jgi:hypothetical protein
VAPLIRAPARSLPDDLMGRLVQFIVAHEVGHTLGFRHNMKASSLYTVAQIRDRDFVRENGHTPSIMDYARFNYVAQPEDGIPVEDSAKDRSTCACHQVGIRCRRRDDARRRRPRSTLGARADEKPTSSS